MMSFSTRLVFSMVVVKEETPVFVIWTPRGRVQRAPSPDPTSGPSRRARSAFPGSEAGESRLRVVSAAPRITGLEQEVGQAVGPFPVNALGIDQLGVDELEAAGQGHAQPTGDERRPCFGLLGQGQVEPGAGGEFLEERLEPDLLVELAELVDLFLQALGDRKVLG